MRETQIFSEHSSYEQVEKAARRGMKTGEYDAVSKPTIYYNEVPIDLQTDVDIGIHSQYTNMGFPELWVMDLSHAINGCYDISSRKAHAHGSSAKTMDELGLTIDNIVFMRSEPVRSSDNGNEFRYVKMFAEMKDENGDPEYRALFVEVSGSGLRVLPPENRNPNTPVAIVHSYLQISKKEFENGLLETQMDKQYAYDRSEHKLLYFNKERFDKTKIKESLSQEYQEKIERNPDINTPRAKALHFVLTSGNVERDATQFSFRQQGKRSRINIKDIAPIAMYNELKKELRESIDPEDLPYSAPFLKDAIEILKRQGKSISIPLMEREYRIVKDAVRVVHPDIDREKVYDLKKNLLQKCIRDYVSEGLMHVKDEQDLRNFTLQIGRGINPIKKDDPEFYKTFVAIATPELNKRKQEIYQSPAKDKIERYKGFCFKNLSEVNNIFELTKWRNITYYDLSTMLPKGLQIVEDFKKEIDNLFLDKYKEIMTPQYVEELKAVFEENYQQQCFNTQNLITEDGFNPDIDEQILNTMYRQMGDFHENGIDAMVLQKRQDGTTLKNINQNLMNALDNLSLDVQDRICSQIQYTAYDDRS